MSSSALVENEEARLAKLASARKKVGASTQARAKGRRHAFFVTLTVD
jgi:hypothetical protein